MSSRWLDSALPPLGTRPRLSQRLVAVPYRHAGLIALCAVAGAIAVSAPSLLHARASLATHGPAAQPWSDTAATMGLQLDLEPGFAIAGDDAARATDGLERAEAPAAQASALQLDDAHTIDEIERALQEAPPAAGLVAVQSLARPAAPPAGRWPLGVASGLLLGLLAAALRELRGQRMRSSREAEWALGAPVLAAIPTLSARARAMLLAPPIRA